MKKIITLFLTLVFIFMMIPAMNSCTPEDKANVVHFLRPGVNSKTDGSFYGNVCLEFEKQTKQTVKLVSSTWDTITEKLTVQAAAGKPVEVFFTGGGAIVWYANKGYAQALNKYVDL